MQTQDSTISEYLLQFLGSLFKTKLLGKAHKVPLIIYPAKPTMRPEDKE